MAIAAIHDWLLVKGTFSLGLELLRVHGKPSATDQFLYSQGETPFSRRKLTIALQELNSRSDVAAANIVTPMGAAPHSAPQDYEERAFHSSLRSEPSREVSVEVLPVELQDLRRDLTSWHKEMTFLRGTMIREREAHALRGIADEVVALHERIKRGWNRIEFYRATGRILEAAKKPTMNEAELLRELRSLNVWISQRKHNVRTCTPEQMKEKEQRKEEVTKLLRNVAAAD